MKTKWKKVLYEDQGVADNYVDETFLEELRKNCKHLLSSAKFIVLHVYVYCFACVFVCCNPWKKHTPKHIQLSWFM